MISICLNKIEKGKQIGIFVFLDFELDGFTNFVVITNRTSWDLAVPSSD